MDIASGFISNPAYAWWTAAALLLLLEMMLTSNWLLWPGLAAFLTGLVAFFFPELPWELDAILFVALSVVLLFVGRKFIVFSRSVPDVQNLNDRTARLLGRRGAALSDGPDGTSRISIEGTEWVIRTNPTTPIQAGKIYEITGVDGTVLIVRETP